MNERSTTVKAFPRILTMAITLAVAIALVPAALTQTASARQDVAVQSVAQATVKTDKFVWKRKDIPRWEGKAPYGKPYHFAIVASPESYYLTADTPRLRVKILRANGQTVVRTFPLIYGHDDLVWAPVFGKKARPLKAWVPRVSWQGVRPGVVAYTLDYGY